MSSSQKQTTNQQTSNTNTVNPGQMAQYQQNYQTAQNNAGALQPYTGQLVAGFTPAQVQAQGILSGVAQNPQYQQALTGATGSLQGILGSLPSGQVNAQPVNAATIANSNLSQYMNPYQQNVIDTTMAQLNQANANQLNNTNQSATAAGAFGGSRSGVADALTNQLDSQTAASTLAGLNSSNYANAQNAAAQDAGILNNMGQFNSAQNLTAQQQSIQNALNSGYLGNTTASNIGNLANANFAMAQNQGSLLGNVGAQQQALQQMQDQAGLAQNQYQNQLTQAQQDMLNQALGMIPVQQTTNGTMNGTTTTTQNPGAMGVLGALGSLGMAAAMPGSAGMLGGSSLLGSMFGGGSTLGNVSLPSASAFTMPTMPQQVFAGGAMPGYFGGTSGYGSQAV